MLKLEPKPDLFARALDEFARAFGGDGAPRPFADVRERAAERLAALGVPTRRDEAWKYTDLRHALARDYAFLHGDGTSRLTRADLDRYLAPGLDVFVVAVVNGAYVPALSDDGALLDGRVRVGSLRRAASGEVVGDYFARYADAEHEPFVALNQAFELDGLFLHVPAGVVVERPIHVLHLTDTEGEAFVQSRHLIVVGRAAGVRVIESHHVHGPPVVSPAGTAGTAAPATFANVVTELVVGPDAVVDHVRIQDEGDAATQVNNTQAVQEARSSFSTSTFTL